MNRTKLIRRRMCLCDELRIDSWETVGKPMPLRTLRVKNAECHTIHLEDLEATE